MESHEFRRGFNVFRRTYEERSIADLKEQRKAVFRDFARQAADVPGCDLVGDEPHIPAPHDSKMGPYAIGAAARFGWSRRSVGADKWLVEQIREHEQVMVGVPAVIDGDVTHAEPLES